MMERIFSVLAVMTVLLIMIAGGGVYGLSRSEVRQAEQNAIVSAARGVASALSQQINLLQKMLDKMAQDPEVIAAVAAKDPARLTAVAAKLEQHLPDILKIRLLLPGVSELDENSVPRMGYADLEMVRETFRENQQPAIQGDEGADRHLAMTSRIMQHDQAIGVILASFNYDFVGNSVKAANTDGYIELRQDKRVLGRIGDPAAAEQGDPAPIKVANTPWSLQYGYASSNSSDFVVMASMIVVPGLLALLAFFVGQRKLSELLNQDLSSLLKAAKDMITGKAPSSYPVQLAETNTIVSALVQYKRVVENQAETANEEVDEFKLDGLLKEASKFGLNDYVVEDEGSDEPAFITEKMPKLFEMPASPEGDDEQSTIFRAYDIRGIVDKTLTQEVVYDIGRALGTAAKNQGCATIVLGRDGRTSSPALADAVAQGIISTGTQVLDIGLVPTPVLYFVAHHMEGRSGVMITGSHNPANYNGLKMVINGETLAGDSIQRIKQCIADQSYATGAGGHIEQNSRIVNEYIGTVSDDIHIARPMKVVLDCGNGAGGVLGPVLLKTLGCEVVELFCDVDGSFPNHHPDPGQPANLVDLIAAVKHHGADVGIAFDGDADRLGVVDSNGKIIWPDRQMMLFAKDVLALKPGAEIIYDVKCSRHLAAQIIKCGGRPSMGKTGHSFMKAKLKETGAMLAGEMSGHIFFNDRWFGFDDALYAASRLVEILSTDSRNSAEVFADFPDSFNTPELNVTLEEGENIRFIENMYSAAQFPGGKITNIDGLRVDFSEGWGLVRASNTTPSLAIRFEADSQQALHDIQEQFRQLMKKIKPDIVLPF